MITYLWQTFPFEILAIWVALALVWLYALPRPQSRPLDYAYPIIPLAVVAAAQVLPAGGAFWTLWLQLFVWIVIFLTVVWGISIVKRDSSIMDIAYGFVMLGAPWWIAMQLDLALTGSTLLFLVLATLGFGRYSLYIVWRNLPHGEDPRYARWRQRSGARWWWWSYFQIFLLQGVVLWVWCMPIVFALLMPQSLGLVQLLGALVWLIGFVFEAGGDWQLSQFKKHRTDKSQLLNTGLWALTRHPNYFGQTCMWWGYAVLSLGHPWGFLSLLPVAYITWFMNKGSATSLMERHMIKTKPGYADYCATVPAFFPKWPSAPLNQEHQP